MLSVSTILFNYRRCSIWNHQLRYILCIAWLCHVELLERFLAYHERLQMLLVFVPQDLVVPPRESRTLGFSCIRRNGNPMVSCQVSEGARLLGLHIQSICCKRCHSSGDTRFCGTNTNSSWSNMPRIFPRVWHDIIRRYTKCTEVGGGHI